MHHVQFKLFFKQYFPAQKASFRASSQTFVRLCELPRVFSYFPFLGIHYFLFLCWHETENLYIVNHFPVPVRTDALPCILRAGHARADHERRSVGQHRLFHLQGQPGICLAGHARWPEPLRRQAGTVFSLHRGDQRVVGFGRTVPGAAMLPKPGYPLCLRPAERTFPAGADSRGTRHPCHRHPAGPWPYVVGADSFRTVADGAGAVRKRGYPPPSHHRASCRLGRIGRQALPAFTER